MIASTIQKPFVCEPQQLQSIDPPKVLSTGSALGRIERLAPLSRTEKLRLRLIRMLKVKTAVWCLSAVAGLAAGQAVQNIERGVTGYDPDIRAQLLERKAQKLAARNGHSQEQAVGAWFDAAYRSVKKAVTNPQEFIEETESYQALLEKYYNTLKVIDDLSFIAPALLLFIVLSACIQRRINRIQDDVVDTAEKERLRSKINELVDAANGISGISGQQAIHPGAPAFRRVSRSYSEN